MKDYSDETAQEVEDKISAWIDEFERSEEYSGLSADEQEESAFVIGVFADLMYGYYLETPEEWSTDSLRACCLTLLPRKVLAGPEFYQAVEPVLTAFFAFLQRKAYIKNSAELTKRLKKIADRIVKQADMSENWGWAKAILTQALEDGVDLADKHAMQKYIDKLNEQLQQITPEMGKGKWPPAGK